CFGWWCATTTTQKIRGAGAAEVRRKVLSPAVGRGGKGPPFHWGKNLKKNPATTALRPKPPNFWRLKMPNNHDSRRLGSARTQGSMRTCPLAGDFPAGFSRFGTAAQIFLSRS